MVANLLSMYTLVQVMVGGGDPLPSQKNSTFSPCSTFSLARLFLSIVGARAAVI